MTVRSEYPRPQLVRENWLNLNGVWDFQFDDANVGLEEKWYQEKKIFREKIIVPFAYETEKSGIGDRSRHDIVWYRKAINLQKKTGKKYLLHFGAVDYFADVYLNGQHVGYHEGGNTSFSFDITEHLQNDDNNFVVRAFDPRFDESILRGKQIWEEKSKGIWYTNTTGIWQTVWLEEVADTYVEDLAITPLFDEGRVKLRVALSKHTRTASLVYRISFQGTTISQGQAQFNENKLELILDVMQEKIFRTVFHGIGWTWSPEHPNLFDVTLQVLVEQDVVDKVESYFGFRKIHVEKGMVYLNNHPYYQKLILDQGYWPESLLTAPDDEAFIKDIKLSKEMGFNGCRKHQKTEDPRFLYWADRLGYLVWGECASAPIYNENAVNRLMKEWSEIVKRDYNHPCIVTWVPLNESWGVPNIQRNRQQQHFSQAIYHYLHAIDSTRLVISNDGWNLTETDICAVHNYRHGNPDEKERYQFFQETLATKENILAFSPTRWSIYADGFSHQGEPILLTEFGGIGFKADGQAGWGYTSVSSEENFISEYQRILKAVYASKVLYGYCYTQLTDVEQEINGLLTYHREPKCSLEAIKRINDSYHQEIIHP